MYEVVKGLHNILRWVVLAGGAYALFVAYRGLFGRATWREGGRLSGIVFTSALNVQLMLGLLLYGISPITRAAMQDLGAAMGDDTFRYFAMEHFVSMILAVVAAQAGFSLAKRAEGERARFVRAAVGYTLAALLVLSVIPWWRPLLPWYWG